VLPNDGNYAINTEAEAFRAHLALAVFLEKGIFWERAKSVSVSLFGTWSAASL
jgi:hypothetical protein